MTALYDCTAGRCCLYCAMVRGDLPIYEDPMHWRARPGEQYNCESIQVTISGTTSRHQWACHQLLLNALACSVFWSPPGVVHHCGCRLASLHSENSDLGCRWAPKPHVHLPLQKRVPGSSSFDHAVRASTCIHAMNRLARGRGSLSLGTYGVPTSYIPLKCSYISHLFCDMHNSF